MNKLYCTKSDLLGSDDGTGDADGGGARAFSARELVRAGRLVLPRQTATVVDAAARVVICDVLLVALAQLLDGRVDVSKFFE